MQVASLGGQEAKQSRLLRVLCLLVWLVVASTVVAVVSHVKSRAIEHNRWRGEHPPHVTMASWAFLRMRVAEVPETVEMDAADEAFIFVDGHSKSSSGFLGQEV